MTPSDPNPLDDASPSDDGLPWRPALAGLLFFALAVMLTIDVVADGYRPGHLVHLSAEIAGVVLALGGVAWLWGEAARGFRHAGALARDLAAAQADAERWRAETRGVLEGLSVAIDRQFDRWGLTPAEAEVALLLLKGMALKEVAQVRGVSERTVRDQARTVYRKAGLAGRAELSAFFLEDLLLPADRRT